MPALRCNVPRDAVKALVVSDRAAAHGFVPAMALLFVALNRFRHTIVAFPLLRPPA